MAAIEKVVGFDAREYWPAESIANTRASASPSGVLAPVAADTTAAGSITGGVVMVCENVFTGGQPRRNSPG